MKLNYIDKGSIAELKAVDPADIFANGSNISIGAGDICLVITTSGWSAFYKAIQSSETVDDSVYVATGISGLLWQRQLYADNNASEFPAGRLSIRADGVLPAGYSVIAKSSSLGQLHDGTAPAATQWALLGLYGGYLYAIDPNAGTAWKVNTSSGAATALSPVNITVTSACGCIAGDYFYVFDTNSNVATRLNLTNDTWGTLATAILGNSRIASCAFYANGKIYLVGGSETGTPQQYVYEYDTTGDSYIQKNDSGEAFYGVGAGVKSATAVYCVYDNDSTGLKTLVYNPTGDSWDLSTVPDNTDVITVTSGNVYYDAARDQLGVLSQGGAYRVAGLDIQANTWSTVHSVGIDTVSDEFSTIFEAAEDRLLHSLSVAPFAAYSNRKSKIYAVKS